MIDPSICLKKELFSVWEYGNKSTVGITYNVTQLKFVYHHFNVHIHSFIMQILLVRLEKRKKGRGAPHVILSSQKTLFYSALRSDKVGKPLVLLSRTWWKVSEQISRSLPCTNKIINYINLKDISILNVNSSRSRKCKYTRYAIFITRNRSRLLRYRNSRYAKQIHFYYQTH